MKILLIGGAPNTGKTSCILRLEQYLIGLGYRDIASHILPVETLKVLEKKIGNNSTKRILVNSATDDLHCINRLLNFLKANQPIDILISSVRDDGDQMRSQFFNVLNVQTSSIDLEIPLAKINRIKTFNAAFNWYNHTIDQLIQKSLAKVPFNI